MPGFGGGHASFEEVGPFAVHCGGKTNTIDAMAGAIAVPQGRLAIRVRWLDALEDGPKGRAHVAALADPLVALGP